MTWNYSNTSLETTLAAGINTAATTISVTSATGLPSTFPYTLVIDHETSNLEVVTVTAAVGTSLTISRAQDGTSLGSHALGARVVHAVVARDLRESQDHIAATSNVHGTGSGASVVGTTTAQTLTNKTISGSSNTITSIPAASVLQPFPSVTAATTLSTDTAFEGSVSGDGIKRFNVDGAGKHTWGTGSATRDTNLYRNGVGQLKTDTALSAASVAATGAVTGATVTATGAVSGASVAATAAITGATITTTGAASVGSLGVTGDASITGNLTANGYLFQQTVYFTSSGTFTKASYPGLRAVVVEAQAGGGGGGGADATSATEASCGAGGGAGGFARKTVLAGALSASETVTVGAAGAASSGGTGGTGGNSSFGAHAAATGGNGGTIISAGSALTVVGGSDGGPGTAGTLLLEGGDGSFGFRSTTVSAAGTGGASFMGGGGRGGATNAVGNAGKAYGGGGGGARNHNSQAARAGGAGGAGLVAVHIYV
jgi:hypothetical protein